MGTKEKKAAKRQSKFKIFVMVLGGLVLLFILMVTLLPVYLSSSSAKNTLLSKINASVQGKADFTNLSVSWFKGVKVEDITYQDDTGKTSVTIKRFSTKPHYGSMLTGSMSFGETVIEEPKVAIRLAEKTSADAAIDEAEDVKEAKPTAVFPIKAIDLSLRNGRLEINDSTDTTVAVAQLDSKVNLRPPGQQSEFDVDMKIGSEQKQSDITAKGTLNLDKKKGWTFEGSTGDLTIEVNELQLDTLESFFAVAGIDVQAQGDLSATIDSTVTDGKVGKVIAKLSGQNIEITGKPLKGDTLGTKNLSTEVVLQGHEKYIDIQKVQIETDWFDATAQGVAPTSIESLEELVKPDSKYDLNADFSCDLALLSQQFPNTLGLKKDMRLTSGRLNGKINTVVAEERKLVMNVNLDQLEGVVQEKAVSMRPIKADAQVRYQEKGVYFDKLDVSSSFMNVNSKGSLESLTYTADMDLAATQQQVGQFIDFAGYEMAGKIQEEGVLSVKEETILAKGTVTADQVNITTKDGVDFTEDKLDMGYDLSLDRKKNILNIESIDLNAELGKVAIKKAVVPMDDESKENMDLLVSANLDLNKAKPYAVAFASMSKKTQLEGRANGAMRVTSSKGIYSVRTESVTIDNLKFAVPDKEPFIQKKVTMFFEAEVDPKRKNIAVNEFRLDGDQIKIIKGRFNKSTQSDTTTIEGTAVLDYNWAAVSSFASAFLPEGLDMRGSRKDTVDFRSVYPGDKTDQLIANLNASAKTGFEHAAYMGLDIGQTEIEVKVDHGKMTLAPFSTTVNNGRLNFAASADFTRPVSVFKIPEAMQVIENIQINDEMTDTTLMYVNPIFANAVDVNGIANFYCEKLSIPLDTGMKNEIDIAGTVGINNLNMNTRGILKVILKAIGESPDQTMTIRPTKFTVKDGFVEYKQMQLDIGDKPVVFQGRIPLDPDAEIDTLNVLLPITIKGETVRTTRRAEGQRYKLFFSGTVRNPQLDVEKILEDQLKKQLIDRGLREIFKNL